MVVHEQDQSDHKTSPGSPHRDENYRLLERSMFLRNVGRGNDRSSQRKMHHAEKITREDKRKKTKEIQGSRGCSRPRESSNKNKQPRGAAGDDEEKETIDNACS